MSSITMLVRNSNTKYAGCMQSPHIFKNKFLVVNVKG